MRASTTTLLIATGLWAMACGSGSGENKSDLGPSGPLENGKYQKPATTYQDPPSTGTPTDYERPPSTYQPPGGSVGSSPEPRPGASLCADLCAMAEDNNCSENLENKDDIAAQPYDQCVRECNGKFDEVGCAQEIAGASSCILDHLGQLGCDELEHIGEGNLNDIPDEVRAACSAPIASLSGCLHGLDPLPDGGNCTVGGQCSCDNPCQRCRCENLGSDASCTDCRNNRN